ncbi:uncharacterized protein LOC103307744 [Acyrthosiphon pisum]|uniref:Integrase catalytic domain-containing protein n=1 Tax=Acyrthosiphon pisum TaxID=7029 RepID=A0A8R2AXR9_ACYPI|nr:uncharacterized protein LOC103307744 [Acyrthosiphon pisum]|eukprot:XP_008178234.1 PREDICTED: uncharacterized protein LOC103307744 [Acyrthosiphon pisum]
MPYSLRRAKQLVYWPELNNEIKQYVLSSKVCDRFKNSNIKEPLQHHKVAKLPFEFISSGILTYGGKDYDFVFDHYSKWLEIIKINFKTAQEVIQQLKKIISTHVYPQIIYSDNQPYSSDVFKQFCVMYNINLLTSSPRYPQSNGPAERAVQAAKQMLRIADFEKKEILDILLDKWNTLKPKVQVNDENRMLNYQANYKDIMIKELNLKMSLMQIMMWLSYVIKLQNGQIVRRTSYHLRHTKEQLYIDNYEDTDDIILGASSNEKEETIKDS